MALEKLGSWCISGLPASSKQFVLRQWFRHLMQGVRVHGVVCTATVLRPDWREKKIKRRHRYRYTRRYSAKLWSVIWVRWEVLWLWFNHLKVRIVLELHHRSRFRKGHSKWNPAVCQRVFYLRICVQWIHICFSAIYCDCLLKYSKKWSHTISQNSTTMMLFFLPIEEECVFWKWHKKVIPAHRLECSTQFEDST